MALFVYVDNSNVWIEGRRASAVAKGLAPDIHTAMRDQIQDSDWSYDFGDLYRLACPEGEKIGRSALFGSRPPASDSLWGWATEEGFEVVVHDRNASNREKKVDAEIVTMMISDSYEYMEPGRDVVVLVAGDGDFLPPIQNLKSRNIPTRLMFWDNASRELREAATEFVSLNPHLELLGRTINRRQDD